MRGVDPARPAPDPDDQEHRDQHRLAEDVEQDGIQGGEDPDHQPFHDQEGGHVLGEPVLNHLPAGDHHEDGDEGGQQDQRHGDAVHAQVVVDVEASESRGRAPRTASPPSWHRTAIQRDADQEGQDRHGQGQRLGASGVVVTHEQHRDAAEDRQPDDKAQQKEVPTAWSFFFQVSGQRTRSAGPPGR